MMQYVTRYFETFTALEHLYIGRLLILRRAQGLCIDLAQDQYTWFEITFGWPYDAD